MEKNVLLIFGIILVALVMLFGKNLGLFSVFTHTMNFEWKEMPWIGESNYDFGTSGNIINQISSDTDLSIIQSQSWATTGDMQASNLQTRAISQNLNINPSNLQKIEISCDSSVSSDNRRCNGFNSNAQFYLTDGTNDILISSVSAAASGASSSANAYDIVIEKSLDRWIATTSGGGVYPFYLENDKIYNLMAKIEGNYVSCFEGGGASGQISLHSINVIYLPSTCNTDADTNCDGSVDRTELGVYIAKWINNEVSREDLGQAIVAWIG